MSDVAARRNRRLLLTVAVAVVLGALGALTTVVFIKVLGVVHDLIWQRLPEGLGVEPRTWYFVVPVCAVGGLLVGVGRHLFGEHPRHLDEAIAEFTTTHAFDYQHIPQAVAISLVSLGFGAALGPEAALVAIIGGAATWIGRVITTDARFAAAERSDETVDDSVTFIGIAGALGALFGTAGAAAITLERGGERPTRFWILLPALAAAGAGALVFRLFSAGGGYFDYAFPEYTFDPADLVWTLPVVAIGVVVALGFGALSALTDRLFGLLADRRVLQSLVGGLILGGLAVASSLALFSGHEGIQELADDTSASFGFFALAVVSKAMATTACLSSGWKGGKFFPLMFIGAATGMAAHAALPGLPPMVGLAAGMTVVLGAALRKPLLAVGLTVFFFPPALYPVALLSAALTLLLVRASGRIAARTERGQ